MSANGSRCPDCPDRVALLLQLHKDDFASLRAFAEVNRLTLTQALSLLARQAGRRSPSIRRPKHDAGPQPPRYGVVPAARRAIPARHLHRHDGRQAITFPQAVARLARAAGLLPAEPADERKAKP
jgi:hypothetical protein